MKNNSYVLIFLFSFSAMIILTASCFKHSANTANLVGFNDSIISIKNFRKLHTMGMVEMITHPITIQGIVVANDEHDNIYKSIYIQDPTGGIVVQLDGLALYQTFPIGTLVKINAQNLFISDYRRMMQLVASVDSSSGSLSTGGIPSPLFSKFIKIMEENVPVTPIIVNYKNLGDSLQGRLIQISGVEFSALDTAQTFADKKNKIGISRSLKFCSGGTIYLRTSGYSDFAGVKTQKGNGIVIGIYSVYNAEKQLLLRDTSDILLTGKRCTGAAWLQNLPQNGAKSIN
ncbi:MAG: hypothetical protein RI940_1720 [Bacteroidota bacterium]